MGLLALMSVPAVAEREDDRDAEYVNKKKKRKKKKMLENNNNIKRNKKKKGSSRDQTAPANPTMEPMLDRKRAYVRAHPHDEQARKELIGVLSTYGRCASEALRTCMI